MLSEAKTEQQCWFNSIALALVKGYWVAKNRLSPTTARQKQVMAGKPPTALPPESA